MNLEQERISFLQEIENSNAAFKVASKAEKRVIIAQDCLTRLTLKMLSARTGCLLDPKITTLRFESPDTNVRNLINNPEYECDACAKGGLFLSLIGRINKFKISDMTLSYGTTSDIYNSFESTEHKKLLTIFTPRQLALIEYAFEDYQHLRHYKGERIKFSDEMTSKISEFYLDYANAYTRLVAICENIIKNGGTFKI